MSVTREPTTEEMALTDGSSVAEPQVSGLSELEGDVQKEVLTEDKSYGQPTAQPNEVQSNGQTEIEPTEEPDDDQSTEGIKSTAEVRDETETKPIAGPSGLAGDKISVVGTTNKSPQKTDPKEDPIVTKYVRKTSADIALKLWEVFGCEENQWMDSEEEVTKQVIKEFLKKFNVKLNESRMKQMLEKAIVDRILVRHESEDKKFRYEPNFDRKQFAGDISHDWICSECHSYIESVPLIDCKSCFRSFHAICLKGDHKPSDHPFNCYLCSKFKEPEPSAKVLALTTAELNKCIGLLLNNLQLSSGFNMFDEKLIDQKDRRSEGLLFAHLDMLSIRHKALTEQYSSLNQLLADFKHFQHNYHIIQPMEMLSALKEFERQFNHELKELRLCVDCYKYSSDIEYDNNDDPHHWFTLVCDPPHELVFAKYQKYPFWPAKVIEVKSGGKYYDVRFFDAPDFSRALIPKKNVRPIEGFEFDDPDGDLELPVQLMEKHIRRMRHKGVYFMPSVFPTNNNCKKRSKAKSDGKHNSTKKSKKSVKN